MVNRTEWSPIWSVIMRVINKITGVSMITDQIGQHEVLLPFNHNFNKIYDIIRLFFKSKDKKFQDFFFG